MLPLRCLYTLVNAYLCVLNLQASTMYELQYCYICYISSMVGKILSLFIGVYTSTVSYGSEQSNILYGMIYNNINVCQFCELML